MRRQIVAAAALALSLGLAACSGTQGAADEPAQQGETQEQGAELDFDGAGIEDTGAGEMYLSTAGGTSESGEVPEIAVADDAVLVQIGLNYCDGDGAVCKVYVDGMEVSEVNAGDVQSSIDLSGAALEPGTHTVEVVAMDGDEVAVYKSAQYSVVE